MGLQVETARIEPDITVVRISGNLTFEATDAVPSLIVALLDRGVKKLILDLNKVDQIDSVGGVSLVRCFFAAREREAGVCVACPGPSVTQLFTTTQIDSLIPFFPTMALARKHLMVPSEEEADTA
jgi:anti-sigma B factor antagonist